MMGGLGRPWGRLFPFFSNVDWQAREVREAIVVAGIVVITIVLSGWLDIYEFLHHQVADDFLELDEIFVVALVLSAALLVYGFRRLKDLKREIAARKDAEKVAKTLARHDPLTALPNRRLFNETFDNALAGLKADGSMLALMMLDLDGFKAINDVYGHLAGDRALIELSGRIGKAARGALVARLGGDEFAVLLPKIASADEAAKLAQRISKAISAPVPVGDVTTEVGVSIGIAVAPADGESVDELVRRADIALYRAKAEGRSFTRFFEAAMDFHLQRRSLVERELRAAIAAGMITPHYQPIVSLEGDSIVGFEALARWTSPALGEVSPGEFIPIAEDSGLIAPLGESLLRAACRDAKRWPGHVLLSFNVSAVQLRDPRLGLRILSTLAETGLPPTRLQVEITESALVGDGALARQVIDHLRQAGIRVALDDFGTGYATIAQLLSYRFDKIKIDRSFVARLGGCENGEVVVRAVIALAKGLGLTTTAEGVESASQLAALKADGCTEAQGFLFGRAVPHQEIASLTRRFAQAKAA